jgi:hypothetical protein
MSLLMNLKPSFMKNFKMLIINLFLVASAILMSAKSTTTIDLPDFAKGSVVTSCGSLFNLQITNGAGVVWNSVQPNTEYNVRVTGGENNEFMCMEPGPGFDLLTSGCNDTAPGVPYAIATIRTKTTLPPGGITINAESYCDGGTTTSTPISRNFPKYVP